MKILELFFENDEGKTVKYTLEKPVEPVDTEEVEAVMDEIIIQNAFTSSGGDIVMKKSARVVETVIEDIDINV